jgi:hypothetical protein
MSLGAQDDLMVLSLRFMYLMNIGETKSLRRTSSMPANSKPTWTEQLFHTIRRSILPDPMLTHVRQLIDIRKERKVSNWKHRTLGCLGLNQALSVMRQFQPR